MQLRVQTFRQAPSSGPGNRPESDHDLDSGSLGLVLDEPDGSLRVEEAHLAAGQIVISRLSSTGYSGRMVDPAFHTFVLQQAGRYDVRIAGRDYSMCPGSLVAFRPNERLTRVWPGRTGRRDALTLQLTSGRLSAIAKAMELAPGSIFLQDGNALEPAVGQILRQLLPQLADDLLSGPALPLPPRVETEIGHMVEDVLCEMVGRTAVQPTSRSIFPAFHRVRKAEDFMHAHSDDPLSMVQVARALGVSLRSLQLAFAQVHDGESPRDVLNRIRLDKARQRLLAARGEGQVTTVALDSGFFHLGRFAQTYARRFGERPSDTLARRCA